MKKIGKRILLLTLALALLSLPALAESISFDGTVKAGYTYEIYAASTAVVHHLFVAAGQEVNEQTVIASLKTNKVYAEEDGTVTAVFGEVGDLTDTVAERYGAVIYLEGQMTYTISATTEKAYESVEAKLVHAGETVYLLSRSDETHKGVGVITAVTAEGYTVYVTEGSFIPGETVGIFRSADYAETGRVGRGDIARNAPLGVSGSGRIVSMAVKAGDTVKKGDLLMETLEGSGDSAMISAGEYGVVAQINAAQGSQIAQGDVAAVIWPYDAMQIEAAVSEADLAYVSVGDQVVLAFEWNADSGETIIGKISSISRIADADSANTAYKVTISFERNESIRYGMNVEITTAE